MERPGALAATEDNSPRPDLAHYVDEEGCRQSRTTASAGDDGQTVRLPGRRVQSSSRPVEVQAAGHRAAYPPRLDIEHNLYSIDVAAPAAGVERGPILVAWPCWSFAADAAEGEKQPKKDCDRPNSPRTANHVDHRLSKYEAARRSDASAFTSDLTLRSHWRSAQQQPHLSFSRRTAPY